MIVPVPGGGADGRAASTTPRPIGQFPCQLPDQGATSPTEPPNVVLAQEAADVRDAPAVSAVDGHTVTAWTAPTNAKLASSGSSGMVAGVD
jgi:hypothetical protein